MEPSVPSLGLTHPLELPLVVYSWNMCNFSAIYEGFSQKSKTVGGVTRPWTEQEQMQLSMDTRRAFSYLARTIDLLILQEFRFNMAQAELVLSWMSNDVFEFAVSDPATQLEYMYIWRKDRLKPSTPMVDQLISANLARSVGSMLFHDLDRDSVIIASTFHLKSGGGAVTQNEFKTLMREYDAACTARYDPSPEAIHLLVGDVNFNPHRIPWVSKVSKGWTILGSLRTVTTVGGNGFDFFLVKGVFTTQHVLPLRRAKNSSTSAIGVSDHYPIYITL